MDDSEKVANEYLLNLALGPVVYEPDGKTPPDFSVNGRIAVEVRRLNQNELIDSGHRGLEETRIPLDMKIRKLLSTLGSARSGVSWFVIYSLKRPLPEWSKLRSALGDYLRNVRDDQSPPKDKVISTHVCDGFEVELRRASVSTDGDTGGWVLPETLHNLRICIDEKTRKIAPFRHKYPEWWLVLIDRIGYGVEKCDRGAYREHHKLEHNWDRIVLLSPLDPRSAFVLPR